MRTFLNFLDSYKKFIIEAFDSKDIDKAFELIDKIFKKRINGLVPLVGYSITKQGDSQYYSKQYLIVSKKNPGKSSMFQINFSQSKSVTDVYSIDFFKNVDYLFSGTGKSDLTLYTLGSSFTYFIPIICAVASTGDYNLSKEDAIKIGRKGFSNAKEDYSYYVDALEYHIYENLSKDLIDDAFELNINEVNGDARDFKMKKVAELQNARDAKDKNRTPANVERWKRVISDLKDIDNALRGGASTLEDLKVAVKHNVSMVAEIDKELQAVEDNFEAEHEDPEQVFKKMQKYVKMVIKGINPSVILCGAPGVGKTFNVKQQLKAAGYHEGHNLCTIKGKCTPRVLYTTLMDYKSKGDIVLIDDADGLVGPGAPEDCINILKAALDSTSDDEGRLISYGVAGKLTDDEGLPIPKRFYYNGGIIVITNYQAGSLDSALKGRSFIQDIHFTVDDMLQRIKAVMPSINQDDLSPKSKIKAYDYLVELANTGTEMQISIRTFCICAKIFETALGDDDFDEDIVKSMIKEQMKLQSQKIRSKKGKY